MTLVHLWSDDVNETFRTHLWCILVLLNCSSSDSCKAINSSLRYLGVVLEDCSAPTSNWTISTIRQIGLSAMEIPFGDWYTGDWYHNSALEEGSGCQKVTGTVRTRKGHLLWTKDRKRVVH